MNSPWHGALRPIYGMRRRGDSEWEHCHYNGCTGITLAEVAGCCLYHAGSTERAAVLERMSMKRHYDLRGTIVSSRLLESINNSWSRLDRERTPEVDLEVVFDFQGCRFTDGLDVSGRTFPRGIIDFTNAVFDAPVVFDGAIIYGTMIFDRTEFREPVSFDQVQFAATWFLSTRFHADAAFSHASFRSTAGFHDVCFHRELTFVGATFAGRVNFDGLMPIAGIYESSDRATISLLDTLFSKRVTADGGVDWLCDGARFEEGLELRLSGNCVASFRRVHFGSASAVIGVHRITANADRPVLQSAPPSNSLRPQPIQPLILSMQGADVENLSLADVDLGYCLFSAAQNLDRLRLDGPIRFAQLPQRGFRTIWNWPVVWRWSRRDVIREEFLWRMGRLDSGSAGYRYWGDEFAHPAAMRGSPTRQLELITGERLAALYRSLRKAREDAKDEPGAGDFYYGEMEARRSSRRTRRQERWLLTAYWALSGYGQRASRAIVALLLLLTTLTVLLTCFGLADVAPTQRMTGTVQSGALNASQEITLDVTTPTPTLPPPGLRWTTERVQRSVRTLATSLLPGVTDQRLTTHGAWIILAGRILGPLLIAFAVLAIRARVKR